MNYADRQATIAAGIECTAKLAPLIGTEFDGRTITSIGGYGRDGAERLDFDDNTARWVSPGEITILLRMPRFKALPSDLRAQPQTLDEAKAFIGALVAAGLLWHFEDDAVDCLHETNPRISRANAELLNSNRDALYTFEWGDYECPIGYALELLD